MKRIIIITLMIILMLSLMTGCGSGNENRVLIYSSAEDYRNDYYLNRLQEHFPDYEIVIEYLATGNHAAKLKAEGLDTECDITLDLEYAYLEMIKDNLAVLSSYDISIFMDDTIGDDIKYFPETRSSGSIVINEDILLEKGLDEPETYEDLLKPEYKGLISMPNPKSSSTGYMFIKNLVNIWGEKEAFVYFDKLSNNILQYTSSGSGPINALVQGEAAIALGMTAHAVTKINEGINLKIIFFEEGAPYSLYGYGIIKGKENKKSVVEVFDYFYETLIEENLDLFYPEPLFKGKTHEINNYPKLIPYSNMENNTLEEKERLLGKWVH